MTLDGFATVEHKEPLRVMPDLFVGQNIALRLTGGVGDALMAIGGTAYALKNKDCRITAAVMPHQVSLMKHLVGVDDAVPTQSLNDPRNANQFDVIFDFAYTFNERRKLKAQEYYSLVSDKVGFPVTPGLLDFEVGPNSVQSVALHPGASNPNRRWADEKWRELAYQLRDRMLSVVWLGTCDEFGFNDEGITKLSDENGDLVWQAQQLAGCRYFIGNDSGFAHLAGMMDMPGTVLFSCTHPDDVIGSYPQLKGAHCFDRLDMVPTRSLSIDDPASKAAIDALTVEDVLSVTGLDAIVCTPGERRETRAMSWKIALISNCEEGVTLAEYLGRYHEVTSLKNVPHHGDEFDVLIEMTPEKCRVRVKGGTEVGVDTHPEHVRRAIRELMHGD